MDLLVDTQILMWSFDVNSPLSPIHKTLLQNHSNSIFVSQVSLMELAIKKNINKLPDFIPELEKIIAHIGHIGFDLLPIKNEHFVSLEHLTLLPSHKGPFDRLLIATAIVENLKIVTTDVKFHLYSSLVSIM